ncbi:unnamed protein product [Heterobilharzia americana]|nr:unnamed protein product [Heterobilharzia americana]
MLTCFSSNFSRPVCNLIESDVHVIISLTVCSAAQLIESQTTPYKVTHVAIPRPACSKSIITSSTMADTTTIWIQPTPERTGRAIYELSEIERAALALLLSDAINLETNSVLDLILHSQVNSGKFVPYFTTQIYSNHNQTNLYYPTSNDHISMHKTLQMIQNLTSHTLSKFLLTHVFQVQTEPLDLAQLYSIFQNRYIFKNFYWIFATTLTTTPNELIRVAMTNQKEKVAAGFFRQFPILNEEDCLNSDIQQNMRLLMQEMFQCNTNNITKKLILFIHVEPRKSDQMFVASFHDKQSVATINSCVLIRVVLSAFLAFQERELQAVYMILLSSQASILIKSLSLDILSSPPIQNCGSDTIQRRPLGQLFYRILLNLAELPKWRNLLFYSLETDATGNTRFFVTGNFSEDGDSKLNDRAKLVAKQSLLSGLFPNVFRTFQNQTINVSTVLEAPYVMGGKVTENLEILDAKGLVIDILNEFAHRLEFRYRLFLPPDGDYGARTTNSTWTGMVGELLAGKTDIVAAPLSINKERSAFVYYVGPFIEDTLGILIKAPDQNQELFQMFLPFRYDIWLCLIGSVFISALAITLFSIISPFSAWNLALPGATSDEVSIYHSIWFTVGGMLMQGQELRAIAFSARTVTLLYWLLVLVIQATWQADLTAYLTRNTVHNPVSSLEDLAMSGYSVAARQNSNVVKLFESATRSLIYSMIYEKIIENPTEINSLENGIDFVRNNTNNMFLGNRITLLNYPYNEGDAFEVVDVSDVVLPVSFAVRLNEQYASLMLSFMSTLREKGVIDHLIDKWDVEKRRTVENSATFNLVNLRNISGAFIVLAVFIVSSLIALLLERIWHKRSLEKEKLHPKSKKHDEGHSNLWRRFTNPSVKLPEPKLDLSRSLTLQHLKYAGHRRASAAFDATVIAADHHTKSNLD